VLFVHAVLMNRRPVEPARFHVAINDVDAPCVWLHSAPARGENRTLSFKIALSPLAPCENFPDGFLEGLRRTLVAGTLATLMAEEGKPYAKPSGVAQQLYAWEKGVYECNARRHTGDTTAPISALNTSWLPEF